MVKAILTTKLEPTYDDLPEERYRFPRTYLGQIEAALGDWIVYYEPRRSSGELPAEEAGRSTSRPRAFIPSSLTLPEMAATTLSSSDYLGFDRPGRFREGALSDSFVLL